jgi:hypothetical protein
MPARRNLQFIEGGWKQKPDCLEEAWNSAIENRILLPAPLFIWPALIAAITFLSLGCDPPEKSVGRIAHLREDRVSHKNAPSELTDIRGVEQHPFEKKNTVATVLVFTMQDCPIANSYIPTLNNYVEKYVPRGIRLLLVHVDPQLTIEQALKHAEEYQIKAPVVIDQQHAWVDRAGATRSPEVAVFSPAGDVLYSGRIDDRFAGLGKRRTHVSTHDLEDAIESILAGSPVAQPKTEAVGCFIPPLLSGE